LNKFVFTKHAINQANSKRIPFWKILSVLENPVECYPSGNHAGQWRYTGLGICVVVADDQQTVVTIYLDRIITPLRQDQIEKGVKIKRK